MFKIQRKKRADFQSVPSSVHSSLKTRAQHGRSMVEMLGVLAIIGVLSIGGIAGYRYAMRQIAYIQISDFIDQIFLFLLKEYHQPTEASDLHCYNTDNSGYIVFDETCRHIDKKFCPDNGTKTSYNGRYFIDHGKESDLYFGWEIIQGFTHNANFWGQMVELDLWTSSPEMCKFVLNKINGNDDYVSIIKGYYRVWVGRTNGKYPDLRGYNTLTDSDIEKICSPYSTAYAGRYSIPIGIGIHTEIYRCTN